jgi:two-component system, cell cycle response regulator
MRILVADDDRFSRMVLKRALTDAGHDIEMVADGDAAVEALCRDDGPRIGIIDWMMPGRNGPEVCEAVRAMGAEPYRYLILLTSRSETADLVAGLDAGADDYLSKPFDAAELRARLRTGARQLELQQQLIEARDALEIQATRDGLTGLYNRRTVLNRLESELMRCCREGRPIGLALIDLDHFKNVNDTWGHLAGDAVLRQACARVEEIVRPYDLVGRYGGEEFIVVVPGAGREQMLRIGERVRACVADGPMTIDSGEIQVTCSIGVASMVDVASGNVIIGAADEALYRAKDGGRNRVVGAWTDDRSVA